VTAVPRVCLPAVLRGWRWPLRSSLGRARLANRRKARGEEHSDREWGDRKDMGTTEDNGETRYSFIHR
jgi:hypothetical protein